MSNKLLNSLIVASTLFVSQQGAAQTCFNESSNNGGPSGPPTCVDISIVEQDGANVDLKVFSMRMGEDISNHFSWYSDVDGNLGYGSQLTAQLSQGVHKIKAVVNIPHLQPYSDTLTLVVANQENNCDQEAASTAETYDEYYALTFVNNEVEPVNVYWLKYTNGERILYGTLEQNETVSLTGYPGNRWVVTDEDNICRSVHFSGYQDETIQLN